MNPASTIATFNLRNVTLQIGSFTISDLLEDGSVSIALESPDRWETSRGIDGRKIKSAIHNDGLILTISGLNPQGNAAGQLHSLSRTIESYKATGGQPVALPVAFQSLDDGSKFNDGDCILKTVPGWEGARGLSGQEWVFECPNGLRTLVLSEATAPGIQIGAAFNVLIGPS